VLFRSSVIGNKIGRKFRINLRLNPKPAFRIIPHFGCVCDFNDFSHPEWNHECDVTDFCHNQPLFQNVSYSRVVALYFLHTIKTIDYCFQSIL